MRIGAISLSTDSSIHLQGCLGSSNPTAQDRSIADISSAGPSGSGVMPLTSTSTSTEACRIEDFESLATVFESEEAAVVACAVGVCACACAGTGVVGLA